MKHSRETGGQEKAMSLIEHILDWADWLVWDAIFHRDSRVTYRRKTTRQPTRKRRKTKDQFSLWG